MLNGKLIMENGKFILFFAFLACISGSIFAQKETPPTGGQPKPFVFPKQEVYTLANGLKVTLVQYGSVPKVAFQTTIYSGTKDDLKGKKGVSEMVALMLKEGTKNRSAEQIARETAEMGGSINTGTGTDSTNITGEVLSEFDTKFIALMADLILNPNFNSENLERLRANKLRDLAVGRTQASNQAWEKFRSVVFSNHPYGQINPTDDEVKNYSSEDIKNFYEANYGAIRTNLYVVGKFNVAAVKAAIAKSFGSMKRGTAMVRNFPKILAKRTLTTIDRPNAPQSTIYLGMPAPNQADADYPKFVVLDSILGGSFGSRITANIRENKGYTYSPSSFIWNRFKTGYWVQSADVTTQFTGASVKEILYEVNRMRNEPITEAELNGIKNYLVGLYVLQNSTRFGVIGQLENMNYNELPKSSIDNYVKEISAVTAADVQNMAKKYLTEDKMAIVVVGDLKKIADQLKPYEK